MAARMYFSESLEASTIIRSEMVQQPRRENHQLQQQQQQEGRPQSLMVRILLVASLFSVEMVMAFEQIYQVLFMQFLGVPLSFISLPGVACGLTSSILLPLMGCFIEAGSDPRKRNMYALFLGMSMFLLGNIVMFMSGLITLVPSIDGNPDNSTNHTTPWPSVTSPPLQLNNLHYGVMDPTETILNSSKEILLGNTTLSWLEPSDTTMNQRQSGDIYVPKPARNAITFAFGIAYSCLFDIGYDMSASLSRAYVVASVPSSQETRILLFATIAQASAGTFLSCFGLFNLPAVLRRTFHVDGTSATMMFFGVFLFTSILGCFLTTTRVGYFKSGPTNSDADSLRAKGTPLQRSASYHSQENQSQLSHDSNPQVQTTQTYKADIFHTEELRTQTKPPTFDDSSKAQNYLATSGDTSSVLDYAGNPLQGEETPLLGRSVHRRNPASPKPSLETHNRSGDESANTSYGSIHGDRNAVTGSPSTSHHHDEAPGNSSPEDEGNPASSRKSVDKRLVAILISEFFACGALLSFCIYISNALTVGIMHGDPTAPEGSDARGRYEKGLNMSARGNVVLYGVYFIVSLSNRKIMNKFGEKLQSLLVHIFLVAMVTALVLTRRIEIYFVCMIIMGCYRPCVFTVPYVLANKYDQENARNANGTERDERNGARTGKIMTLVGFCLPLHYCLLSAFMGPLMHATGNVFVPIIYCSVSAAMSLFAFSTLFFMSNS